MDLLPELAVHMACQSTPLFTRHFLWIPALICAWRALLLGSASIWAEAQRTKIANIVAPQ